MLKKYKNKIIYFSIIILLILVVVFIVLFYKEKERCELRNNNQYNLIFSELVKYIKNVENYLAKSLVCSTSEYAVESLTNVWKESNLAQVYLSQLPISSNELINTTKFLNQVSDYSYSLSRKNIYGQNLKDEDFANLQSLYDYSCELYNVLAQLYTDMYSGRISWRDLTKDEKSTFAQQVDNLSVTSFSNIEGNFGEYEGLIYDGAYSNHIENIGKRGLVGEEIDENFAKEFVINFVGKDNISKIVSNGLIENGSIQVYDFYLEINSSNYEKTLNISISKKGGYIVLMSCNREVLTEKISIEEADNLGNEFLKSININNMKSTYYLIQGGIATINYAFQQDDITVYPDLIKVKIALDNGEIMGLETSGYLNNHIEREIGNINISEEEARNILNKNLVITSSNLAIIPTEYKTEILCYEFKGKVGDIDFLAYINCETGEEENVLIIINTPNGILTQ